MEKWSIDKLHAVEKPHEQRSYTACYHGADSDALAIYKYANTTAFRLHWSRIYTPTKVSASLTTTVFLFYLFISPTLCVCVRARARACTLFRLRLLGPSGRGQVMVPSIGCNVQARIHSAPGAERSPNTAWSARLQHRLQVCSDYRCMAAVAGSYTRASRLQIPIRSCSQFSENTPCLMQCHLSWCELR